MSKGIIIKIISNLFVVKCEEKQYNCSLRGKIKIKPVVGDKVEINTETKTIENILPRTNYLERPPVSNIDIALIVTSIKKPEINLTLLDKLISIVTINNIEPVIIFTKEDLSDKKLLKEIKKLFKYYESIGIKVFTNKKVRKIKKYLKNKIATVCGQTGAGKSTLINKFDKNLNLETNEISEALGRGKHTTRVVELFNIDNFFIVDTPGFSSIDINTYTKEDIKNSFIEIRNIECKYKDCNHLNEDGCNVIGSSKILKSRYENYQKFIKECR